MTHFNSGVHHDQEDGWSIIQQVKKTFKIRAVYRDKYDPSQGTPLKRLRMQKAAFIFREKKK